MAQSTTKRPFNGPSRISRQMPEIMKKAYERFGFAYGDVLSRWPEIIGTDLAEFTSPERVRWPRRREGDTASGRKAGGTLIIRVDGPVAIEVQHSTPQIMERINGYYGYSAIVDIKIVQGPVPRREKRPPAPDPEIGADAQQELDDRVRPITDPRLKATLAMLGRNIKFAKK